MKITKYLSALLILVSGFFTSGYAQEQLTPEETKKLAREAEDADFFAMELMMEFLVMRDAETYEKAFGLWNTAFKNYEQVMTKGTVGDENETLNGLSATVYDGAKSMVQSRLYSFDAGTKKSVLDEKEGDRKKTVMFKGISYPISKAFKTKFEMLEMSWSSKSEIRKMKGL